MHIKGTFALDFVNVCVFADDINNTSRLKRYVVDGWSLDKGIIEGNAP